MWDLLLTEQITKAKPDINLVKVHSQLINNRHLVDGVQLDVGSSWLLDLQCQSFKVHVCHFSLHLMQKL